MKAARVFALLFLINLITYGYCTLLAMSGYLGSNPAIRNFLIRSGFSTIITRKAESLYENSNFRYASDQGTDVRKAQMDTHDIVEVDSSRRNKGSIRQVDKRNGLHVNKNGSDEDRIYSESLFAVLTEMDKNSCVFRLLCEIGADPKAFGIMGYKINHYVKSVPPVTWNSATFSYLEAFQAGLEGSKDICVQHYASCPYNLNRVVKFLWTFMRPLNS